MNMSMFELIAISARALAIRPFLEQTEAILAGHPSAFLLREKDLSAKAYFNLAKEVLALCKQYDVPCILHSFPEAARELGCEHIHLPLPLLKKTDLSTFSIIGSSVHSVAEAQAAQACGATYLIAGHIFSTACKADLPPRGISFLQEIQSAVSLPVYAIGGIHAKNLAEIQQAGARGACIMSGLMQAKEPSAVLKQLYALVE